MLIKAGQLPPESAMLRFSASDTGIGIPPEKCDVLFVPFIQVDASKMRKYGGGGAGPGRLGVTSRNDGRPALAPKRAGQGEHVHFKAQFRRPMPAAAQAPSAATPAVGGTRLVLCPTPLPQPNQRIPIRMRFLRRSRSSRRRAIDTWTLA